METDKPPAITTADAPFHDPTDSVDLVIRTADNVDFFVLSALLSLRSPSSFFRHVLQGNRYTEERDGFPVLRVEELSTTFRFIILLCYPNSHPGCIKTTEDVSVIGDALEKYCMDYATERFEKIVSASALIRDQALQLFILAIRKGWRILAEAAAKNTLFVPLNKEVAIEELNDISALQYVMLRDYHRKCSDAAQTNLKNEEILFLWIDPKDADSFRFLGPHPSDYYSRRCQSMVEVKMRGDNGDRNVKIHGWTSDYIREVSQKLCETPRPEIALDEKIISRAVLSSGMQCQIDDWKDIAVSEIQAFAKLLSEEIDRRITEVPLDIKWTKHRPPTMDFAEQPPITTADPPFNDASNLADLADIRQVDFSVHRAFLLLKSPSSCFRYALYGSHHTEEICDLPVLPRTCAVTGARNR
ncbi:uncharacterized protein ARMOST_17042 [Armillaria ostoyae]|uniref:BTB domain-containing protein n=1 Tax=Armillaria ostoyae TaxID=47428 RepID=A0A284RXX0_ARMOS|nr:uncharacterized protein ARMOST_17042 [Armillaria ostoyae]